MKFFKYLSIGAFVFGWIARSAIDGVITREEQIELLTGLIEMSGKDVKVAK